MTNDAKKYCYAQVAKPGGAFYYSLRKLTAEKRDALVAVHALYREITDTLFSSQEPNVTIAKFAWWRNEVMRDQFDHPVLIFLKQFNLPKENLLAMIDGIAESLHPAPFATFEDVVIHLMRSAGNRELLLTQKSSAEIVYQLMLVIELTHYLQHLRFYLQHNVVYFPADELVKFNVTLSMLNQLKMTPQIKNLLLYQIEKIERAYQAAKSALRSDERVELSSLIIRAEMAKVLLKEIQRSDFSMFDQVISLTPIKHWWIAFRCWPIN